MIYYNNIDFEKLISHKISITLYDFKLMNIIED